MKGFFTSADAPSANLPATDRIMRSVTYLFAAVLLTTSCIFDSPNDQFYRTLWVSEEAPFSEIGQTSDGRITIEFLCGGSISVTATGAAGSYGSYQTFGNTAYFVGLTLTCYGHGAEIISTYREAKEGDSNDTKSATDNDTAKIVMEEAHRTGDILLVSWHIEGSPTSYSTRFSRRSSYG